MLARRWAFEVENKSGDASGQITILGRTWKIDPATGLAYAAEATLVTTTGLADAGFFTGTIQENGTALDYGGHFLFTVTGGAGAAGDFICYMKYYNDAGSVSASPGLGFAVATITPGPSGTLTTQIEI